LKLHDHLTRNDVPSVVLDGDEVRKTFSKDLGFSEDDRRENVRRVAEHSKNILDSGGVVLIALISPFEADRLLAKEIIGTANFIEVFVDCQLAICESRDVKGLYRKARAGEIKNFTGISSPYEPPASPDIIIHTDQADEVESMVRLIESVMPLLYTDRRG
jgi:adenylylsulfate kinase